MGVTLLLKRRDLLDLLANPVATSALFAAVYVATFSLWLHLTPESISWCNTTELSSIRFGLIPVEEVLFSLSMGFFAGPLYQYLTRAVAVRT